MKITDKGADEEYVNVDEWVENLSNEIRDILYREWSRLKKKKGISGGFQYEEDEEKEYEIECGMMANRTTREKCNDDEFDGFSIEIFTNGSGTGWRGCFQQAPSITACGETPEDALNNLKGVWTSFKDLRAREILDEDKITEEMSKITQSIE